MPQLFNQDVASQGGPEVWTTQPQPV